MTFGGIVEHEMMTDDNPIPMREYQSCAILLMRLVRSTALPRFALSKEGSAGERPRPASAIPVRSGPAVPGPGPEILAIDNWIGYVTGRRTSWSTHRQYL